MLGVKSFFLWTFYSQFAFFCPLPYSKNLILVIEDDSHVSRLVRNYFEQAFPEIRVEIAGSTAKARMICERFNPQVIIWDGEPNERGTREDYAICIPDAFWRRVISISVDTESQDWAKSKGSTLSIPKPKESLKAWAGQLANSAKQLLSPSKSKR